MYATGEGMEKSEEEFAIAYFKKSAELGFAEAQYDLGVRYIVGRGVPKNEATGLEWYKKAAAQGYKEAIDALRQHGIPLSP
jgi:TPR repeat protein